MCVCVIQTSLKLVVTGHVIAILRFEILFFIIIKIKHMQWYEDQKNHSMKLNKSVINSTEHRHTLVYPALVAWFSYLLHAIAKNSEFSMEYKDVY